MTNLLNELFPHKFFINLDRATDRCVLSCQEFNKYHLENVFRCSAIDGYDLIKNGLRRGHLTAGQQGCLMSHLKIYQHCINYSISEAVIFEDDIVFDNTCIEIFNNYYDEIPNDWEIIMLGGFNCESYQHITQNIIKITRMAMAHAYIIKLNTMKLMIEYTKNLDRSADGYLGDMHSKVPSYSFYKSLISQYPGFSYINNTND